MIGNLLDIPPGFEGFGVMAVLLIIISLVILGVAGIIKASHPRTYIDDDGDRYGFGKVGHRQTIDQLLELDRRDQERRKGRT